MIRGFWTFLVAAISMMLVYTHQNAGLPEPLAQQSQGLDVSQWKFDEQPALALQQHWRFYPDQLIDAGNLSQPGQPYQNISTPHLFAHSGTQTGQAPTFGSYVLPLTFKAPLEQTLSLYFPRICNSARVYFQAVNGSTPAKPLLEIGKFSRHQRLSGHAIEPTMIDLAIPTSGRYALVVQVGAAQNAEIGMCETPYLGEPNAVFLQQRSLLLFDGLTIAIIFSFGLFALATSLAGSRNRSYVWLGSLAMASTIMLWSGLNLWQNSLGIDAIAAYQIGQDVFLSYWIIIGPLLLGFVHHSFKQHFISERLIKLNLIIALAAVTAVIILPTNYYLSFSKRVIFFDIVQIALVCYVLFRAYRARLDFSRRMLINTAPLIIAISILILEHLGLISGPRQLKSALVFLMMSQGMLQSQKLARASRIASRLSLGLGEAVKQQTAALDYKNQQLLKIQTKLTQANQELQTLSITDGLTGVYNRMYFDRQFIIEWQRSRREQECISILLLDIDHFKKLNDVYGHSAGDEALKQISQLLLKTFKRGLDFVCRYGGEEFVILLTNTNRHQAFEMAQELRLEIELHPIFYREQRLSITASIGVYGLVPGSEHSSLDLLNAADQALYRAKRNGRNQVQLPQNEKNPQLSPEILS